MNDRNGQKTVLVFGASGQTGQHFVSLALAQGYRVRAVVRTPPKLAISSPDLQVHQGDITGQLDLDGLLRGVDFVVAMLGDRAVQSTTKINEAFVRQLVPAMRRQGVGRFLYQAGGLSAPPRQRLPAPIRVIRATLARSYDGQHLDNEAVMVYLTDEASDLEWTVHRAGIGSDGPSRGVLERSASAFSIATFVDCAAYSLRLLTDPSAVHTCDLSQYRKG